MLRILKPTVERVDLKTVQQWLGHTDLASTMRYLRAAREEGVKAKVEAIWGICECQC